MAFVLDSEDVFILFFFQRIEYRFCPISWPFDTVGISGEPFCSLIAEYSDHLSVSVSFNRDDDYRHRQGLLWDES